MWKTTEVLAQSKEFRQKLKLKFTIEIWKL